MKVSIRQIAKEAGVSITTVSRIVNGDFSSVREDTKARVLEIVEKYNYQPSKSQRRDNSQSQTLVGVVLPNSEPFFVDIAKSIDSALNKHGLDMIVKWSEDDIELETKDIKKLGKIGVLGILYMSTTTSPVDCYGELIKNGIPFVVLDSYLNEYNVPAAVFVDGEAGIYEMTKYLISNGHKNIAYISGISYDCFSHGRYQGYAKALLENGIAVDPDIISFGRFSIEEGKNSLRKLFDSGKKFTAVVCESDVIALGAMEMAIQSGLNIPGDLSITGFDDSLISKVVTPRLTTVKQPIDQIAQKAVEMLLAQVKGEIIQEKIVLLPPEIVIRDSVLSLK